MVRASLAEAALMLVRARRVVERQRAEHPRPDADFEIRLCSPCPGGHDDDDGRPRDFGRGYTLCLIVDG